MKKLSDNHPALEDDEPPRPPRPRKELRQGFATGTAAAAAAQGALYELLVRPCPDRVEVPLPGGGSLSIPLHRHERHGTRGEAVVIKDAGDDPDVTNRAEIGARVWRLESPGAGEDMTLLGGEGVGRVTKPGLPVAVGEPAINPVPRRMIRRGLRQVWDKFCPGEPLRLRVEIFVPRGEELARHTLNPRLGIVGGISILGTTGLVKPFSHQAYRATIASSLRVAQAAGLTHIGFSTGGKSEEHLKALMPELPEEALVQMGDYVRFALKVAGHMGFSEITAAAFFGKALKIAQGFGHTHASRGLADLKEVGPLDPGPDRRCGPGPGGGRSQHRPADPGTSHGSRGRPGSGPGGRRHAGSLAGICRSAAAARRGGVRFCRTASVAGRKSGENVAAGFTVKNQIPLNPPLLKGDFNTPL